VLTSWDQAEGELLGIAGVDVQLGVPPRSTLAAYRGDEPVALTELRPFAPGEIVDALVEVLALLLPLGADRVALAAPARAWSLDDPAAGEVAGFDLRPSVVLVTTVDGHERATPDLRNSLHPYGVDDHGGAGWLPTPLPDDLGAPEGPVAAALSCLVGGREALTAQLDEQAIVLQFARCLLKGHAVVLAPPFAAQLELATAGVADR
jgi:hypothetical protein